jgi:ABC-type xylose transport system permease subunit
MRRVLVLTGAFAALVFVGYLLLSDSAVWVSLVKAVVVGSAFGLVQLWLVRRRRS